MAITDQINQRVQRLPCLSRWEVLNFIEFLIQKAEQQEYRASCPPGRVFASIRALRDMDDDEFSLYNISDLKIAF